MTDALRAVSPNVTWPTKRLRFLASINDRTLSESTPRDAPLRYMDISSVNSDGSTQGPEEMQFEDAPSRARRLPRSGDTAVSTVRPYLKAIAFVDDSLSDCVWSTGFALLSPGPELHPRFLYYVARSGRFVAEVQRRSVGVSYPAVNADDIADIACPVPLLEEQRRIADLLDAEVEQIDRLAALRHRTRALLTERSFAEMSRRTLGSERAGRCDRLPDRLPDGWRSVRLKFVARLQAGVTLGKVYGRDELVRRPYLRVANVQDGFLNLGEIAEIELPADEALRYELAPGDVLMTEGGDRDKLGRGCVWRGQIERCLHQNHVFAVRPAQELLRPEFLASTMSSSHGKSYFESTAHQTTNLASTNSTKLMNLPVPLPPLGEQERIVRESAEAQREQDSLDRLLSAQLVAYAERRDALITAAVTGELDPTSYRDSAVAA